MSSANLLGRPGNVGHLDHTKVLMATGITGAMAAGGPGSTTAAVPCPYGRADSLVWVAVACGTAPNTPSVPTIAWANEGTATASFQVQSTDAAATCHWSFMVWSSPAGV